MWIEASSSFSSKAIRNETDGFFARLGADPLPHCRCGKGLQRRMAEKDTVSCIDFGESDH
jgi:hypothetical protein